MSKQLAISSCFSIFAMACLMLASTQDHAGMSASDGLMQAQTELPSPHLPRAPLFP